MPSPVSVIVVGTEKVNFSCSRAEIILQASEEEMEQIYFNLKITLQM